MATIATNDVGVVRAAVLAAVILAAATVVTLAPAPPAGAVAGAWAPTGSLAASRERATATLLDDGSVLVAGGGGRDADGVNRTRSSAEIYRPATGAWSPTAGPMAAARQGHTATLLTNGKILIVGGRNDDVSGASLASAEIYDPATATFSPTGSMAVGRQGHTATRLDTGEVFVQGGSSDAQGDLALGTAEIFNRGLGTWRASNTPPNWPPILRVDNRANRLFNGQVLLTGDQPVQRPAAELYLPTDDTVIFSGAMANARRNHTATVLMDDTVLIQGGVDPAAGAAAATTAERYDWRDYDEAVGATGSFSPTGSLARGRTSATATLLYDGTVLVAGGTGVTAADTTEITERYNPESGTWSDTGAMAGTRWNHTGTLLRDGTVLVAGGSGGPSGTPLASAERYDPGAQSLANVSLSLRKHLVASGTVGGAKPCIGNVPVTIRLNGAVVATATSLADGRYEVRLPDQVGPYQASTKPPPMVGEIPCGKAVSPVVKHRH